MRITRTGSTANSPEFAPTDHGFLAWSLPPSDIAAASAIGIAGQLYVAKLKISAPAMVSSIVTVLGAGGTSLTAGQCKAALYQGGSLLGTTVDQAAAWATGGEKVMALAGDPVAVQAGYAHVGVWFQGSGSPTFFRSQASGTSPLNVGLAAADSRTATANTGITTTAPGTLGAFTAFSMILFMGLKS